MKVRVFCKNSEQVVGELEKFTFGNDGLWIHLTNCDPGQPLQGFAVEHLVAIRPEPPVHFAVVFTMS